MKSEVPSSAGHSIILFDGVCNFCNSIVNFIIVHDKKDKFRFASQQSATGQKLLNQYNILINKEDTFYFIEKENVYSHSTGALRIFRLLPWYLCWIYSFIIIPKFIRDYGYKLIAKNRYKLFGKKDNCMIPTPEFKVKFLE